MTHLTEQHLTSGGNTTRHVRATHLSVHELARTCYLCQDRTHDLKATRLVQRQRNSPYMGNATSIYELAGTSITNGTARLQIPLSARFRTQFSPSVTQLPQKILQPQALGRIFNNSCAHLDELFILPRVTILTRFSSTAPRHPHSHQ